MSVLQIGKEVPTSFKDLALPPVLLPMEIGECDRMYYCDIETEDHFRIFGIDAGGNTGWYHQQMDVFGNLVQADPFYHGSDQPWWDKEQACWCYADVH